MALAHVRTVIVNSEQPERLVAFWSAMLGVDVAEDDAETGITWLRPDTEGGVNIGVQRVSRKRSDHSEVHLDVEVPALDDAQARVEALGGRHLTTNRLANGFEWRIMADPDGNELCIFAH